MGGRDQLRARPRVHVHELREVELDAQLLDWAPDLVNRGAAIVAIRASSSSVSAARIYSPGRRRSRVDRHRTCRRRGQAARGALELDELDGDLDHQPVVLAQVDARQLHDAPQPLAQRVRVDVQRLGRRGDVAAAAQELLERGQERGRAQAIVLGEPRDRVAVGVADVGVERHPQQVLVRAELVVGHDARARAEQHARAEQRVPRLLEAGPEAGGPAAGRSTRRSSGRCRARRWIRRRSASKRFLARLGGHAHERPHRIVPPVEERAAARRSRARLLEAVVGGAAASTT